VLTVEDVLAVLAVPVVASAEPRLLTPPETASREVRWVHTSEIYDIGPLLKGRELLLTTGLGLVGQSPERLRRYVDSLADRGVAGVCLELGRTFDRVPVTLLDRAAERGLAVVALHAVVPFVAMTEAVHDLLLGGEVAALRAAERLSERLLRSMADGLGLDALLGAISAAADGPIRLVGSDGTVVAETAGADAGLRPAADILVGGRVWGRLCSRPVDDVTRLALQRAAAVLAVYLSRSDASVGSRAIARRVFFRAVFTEGPVESVLVGEALDRLGLAAGRQLVPCAIEVGTTDLPATVAAVEDAVRAECGAAVATDVVGGVLVVIAVPAGRALDGAELGRKVAGGIAGPLARRRASTGCVVVGEVADDVMSLRARVDDLRSALALVPQAPGGAVPGVVLSRDLALPRLLASGLASAEMIRYVDRQLGPLLEHDARHRRGLLPTLDAYLDSGGNKLATAAAIGVQRQTLYDRLTRIEAILGVDLTVPATRTALHVAVTAWRLRAGAAGFAHG